MAGILETDLSSEEAKRLKKLERYEILDTKPEFVFDTLAKLAAEVFNVENATIFFIDADYVFHKAIVGKHPEQTIDLYRKAILNTEITIVEDFIFAPLVTPEGFIVGSIRLMNDKQNKPAQHQIEMLKMLASLVIDKLESRLAMRTTMRAQDNRVNMMVHDLKNPMTTISLQSELVGKMPGLNERTKMIAGKINAQSINIVDSLNNIVSTARSENAAVKLQKAKVDFNQIFKKISNDFDTRLKAENLNLIIDSPEIAEVYGDESKLYMIVEELIENAIKFSNPNGEIKLRSWLTESMLHISIQDNGIGILETDLERLFIKFAKFNHATEKAHSHEVLGLILAKTLVDLHKGKLWAESDGKDKGATFFIELPIK
ncbi:HAMP domain-containing sensor histidine kinase [Pedobacter aquatilis]|uniref:sensor histidine kinase n=1 Tax=Pedobacter aquatilis TaxID=351343 RepID=UPI002931851F|nr:HAMP domain-containing sensor histidine kinase [Pedobacter aquatilis]